MRLRGHKQRKSLHVVQIVSYEEMNPTARNITSKLVILPSLVVSLHSNHAVTCQRSPKFHTNVSNFEMASPQIHTKSLIFSNFLKPSTWLQSNNGTSNLVNRLILM